MTTNRLEGVTEKLIPTALGLINVRVGGRPDGPAMMCWPSLMTAPCGSTSTSTSPRPTA
ncbi:hypothetical protein [Streptomyces olivochromogenes]|nr:hypothetical protein [Streptomyces olivochromogenes]